MEKPKVDLNLNDLRVESFEALPELNEGVDFVGQAEGTGCYYLCETGCESAVCCDPTCGCGTP